MSQRRRIKERVCQSIVRTLRYINPSAAKVESPEFHYEIDRRMRNLQVEKVNAVAPRGHAKSTLLAVTLVIWHVFFEPIYRELNDLFVRYDEDNDHRDYEPSYVLVISKTQKDAKKRLREIKNVLGDVDADKQSETFRALFGEWGERTALTWREDMIILKDGTTIQAVGTGQNVHGLKEGNTRPTLILVDDPENSENTKTPEAKRSNMKWLFQGIVPARDPQIGRVCVVGTPIDTSCMVVNLHNSWQKPELESADSIWFQNDVERGISRWSVAPDGSVEVGPQETVEEDDNGRWLVKNELLWPGWYGEDELIAERETIKQTEGISVGVYYRMYECKIQGDEEQIFQPAFFTYTWTGTLQFDRAGNPYLEIYAIHGTKLDEEIHRAVAVTTGIDPAYSTAASADHTAIVNVATDKEGRIYELEGVFAKIDPTRLLQAIQNNYDEFQPMRTMMEANGPQKYVYDNAVQELNMPLMKDTAASSQKKKGEGGRIHMLQPKMKPEVNDAGELLKAPEFHHRRGSPLKDQLLNYPRGGDDYADACEKAVRVRTRPYHDVKTGEQGEDGRSVLTRYKDPMLT